ncbi:hypothetical protein ASZ78_001978 [Callipepla squamata]|uniref:GAIN-B domain-containing protein n=1 Tax=Callipepla squamata TaxID=9009 RepID=A0A226MXX4_CALSU|nr:hypothetical protein ASZ78_001978 [Callipepla squamata]
MSMSPGLGMHSDSLVVYLLLALLIHFISGETEVKFGGQTEFVVNETSTTVIRLVIERTGKPANVTAVVSIHGEDTGDFFDTYAAAFIPDTETNRTVYISVCDDDLPEADETFTFYLTLPKQSSKIKLGSPKTVTVTILSNDNAFGIISFNMSALITVNEPRGRNEFVPLTLIRERGTYGTVIVTFEIKDGPNPAEEDFSPAMGNITFTPGRSTLVYNLTVLDDQIPENDELFVIYLRSVEGGAEINTTKNSIQINIRKNDSPVHFIQSTYMVPEEVDVLRIQVVRGKDDSGKLIGPDDCEVSVSYAIITGNSTSHAQLNLDFLDLQPNTTIVFPPLVHEIYMKFKILDDAIPEIAETFQIMLLKDTLQGDAVLVNPSTVHVTIQPNDKPYGVLSINSILFAQTVIIDEDQISRFEGITIVRNGGTHGNISVTWVIIRNSSDSSPVTEDLIPETGEIYFNQGQMLVTLALNIINDDTPEEAEPYLLKLLDHTVQGGAEVSEPSELLFYIQDSDDVYGLIKFYPLENQKIESNPTGRFLSLSFARERGTVGDVQLIYTALYIPAGDLDPERAKEGILNTSINNIVMFPEGRTHETLNIPIRNDAFLQNGAHFLIQLKGVELVNRTPLVPSVSPRLGEIRNISLRITPDIANGEIGFISNLPIILSEPEDSPATVVSIALHRDGTDGRATVFWSLKPSGLNPKAVTHDDISPFNGSVVFLSGQSDTTINITIKADDIPEMNETVLLTLDRVETERFVVYFGVSVENQILKYGFTTREIIILENDDPGGVFEFSPSSRGPYSIKEGESVELQIVRTRGSLVRQFLRYTVEPRDNNEFYGSTGILEFKPGEREIIITLLTRMDGIPELDEVYFVVLSAYSEMPGKLGNATTVSITILKNDDPHGIIEFLPDELTVTINESKGEDIYSAIYRVIRNQGKYGSVNVSWVVDPACTNDVYPEGGTIFFDNLEFSKNITIYSLPDEVPEEREVFIVSLVSVTGGARLGNVTTAILQIAENDDPIYFAEPLTVTVQEGSAANFTVLRNGSVDVAVAVQYVTVNGDATAEEGDFVPTGKSSFILFNIGEREQNLSVYINDDDTPETDEMFYVFLLNSTGDTVIFEAGVATVIIEANDDPNGIFSLEPLEKAVEEGKSNIFFWQLFDNNSTLRPGDEFYETYGTVFFMDGERSKPITLHAISDRIPEFNEFYILKLVNASGGSPGPGGQLSETNLSVIITIPFNDDPFGVFVIDPESQDREIVEDTLSEDDLSYIADFTIWRQQGTFGVVRLGWEILSTWLIPNVSTDGYIVEKDNDNGTLYYGVKLQTNDSHVCVVLHYTALGSNMTYMAKTAIVKYLDENTWLHLLITLDESIIEFYIDGILVLGGIKSLKGEAIVDGPGIVRIGAGMNGSSRYTGLMQDVRLYERKLTRAEIYELHATPAKNDVHPVSGYLEYQQGETNKSFIVSAKDDNEEEGEELFILKLICVRGGARISHENTTARLRIQKSDNANGLFGFTGACIPEVLNLHVIDDDIPELNEYFRVTLVSAVSGDGKIGSTPTSGASIDPEKETTDISIKASDHPYGLLQFSVGLPPQPDDKMILPAYSVPHITVKEEVGHIRLLVVRAQGLLGTVLVEYRTVPLTAFSPKDYQAVMGTLEFQPGERYKYITVNITDNSIPELEKTFEVELLNPEGGASLGIASHIIVTIEASDDAHGVFEFSEESLSVYGTEPEDGDSNIVLQIVRTHGALSEVTLHWVVDCDLTEDLISTYGNITFSVGQVRANITVQVSHDEVPELDKMFSVLIINISSGRLGNHTNATLTVLANDDPYGLFIFSEKNRPIKVEEEMKNISLTIVRLGGLFGTVMVTYRTLGDDEQLSGLPPNVVRAIQGKDYIPIAGYTVFAANESEATISLPILDDDDPERSESIFVELNNTVLIEKVQDRPIVNSPRLGSTSETIAHVIINANDDAFGTLQLSASTVRVAENYVGPIINVTRTGGIFADVSVKFKAMPITATAGEDYSVASSDVVLLEGETSKAVPIYIINDINPEVEESFYVQLLNQTTGGALLGLLTRAIIIIEASDDPFGSFVFQITEFTVEEPEFGSVPVHLPVIRNAGTLGNVTVHWTATIDGHLAHADLRFATGNIAFAPGETFQMLLLEVLADDVPEIEEIVLVVLTQASNGGAIGLDGTAKITIPANDNPYGTVFFHQSLYRVQEPLERSLLANITVRRSEGRFGQLQIFYSTSDTDIVALAVEQGQDILSYYEFPVQGIPDQPSKTRANVSAASDPVYDCATQCLKEQACSAFTFSSASGVPLCLWLTSEISPLTNTSGFWTYRKNFTSAFTLFSTLAIAGSDYEPVTRRWAIMEEGEEFANLTVTILPDDVPELDEEFTITLLKVELMNISASLKNQPTIGQPNTSTVIIMMNGDAFGVFKIYSVSPNASERGLYIEVEERPQTDVQLMIHRTEGSLGQVTVQWHVTGGTATPNVDFIGVGETLVFAEGETKKMVVLTILDDPEPEDDESIKVSLIHTEGGSRILPSFDTVTVIILASDNVAGIISFHTASRSVIGHEGEQLQFHIVRTAPGLGNVTVEWKIVGHNVKQNFETYSGILFFAEGMLNTTLYVHLLDDHIPEEKEEYQIILHNIRTEGVSPTGAAALDNQGYEAVLTVEASDEPHGVLNFASTSRVVLSPEENKTVQLFINREFGSLGTINITYATVTGMLSVSNQTEPTLAEPGDDYIPASGSLILEEGETSAAINITILEDDIPEVQEFFLVNLTSVELIMNQTILSPPRLDVEGLASQIIIDANDGVRGVIEWEGTNETHVKDSVISLRWQNIIQFIRNTVDFHAASKHLLFQVNESHGNLTIMACRNRGSYGNVSVFFYAQNLEAQMGLDFYVTSRTLFFADGERRKSIDVMIFDDETPEGDEKFQLILTNPSLGLELGENTTATVTILANDDGHGVLSFNNSDHFFLREQTAIHLMESVAVLTIIREPPQGIFGTVTVQYLVSEINSSEPSVDLTPSQGYIVLEEGVRVKTLHISAILDEEPEMDEHFIVTLFNPTGGARLGTRVETMITVLQNQAPLGLFSIYPVSNRTNFLIIEEANTTVYLKVSRTNGLNTSVSIEWETLSNTAFGMRGDISVLSVVQSFVDESVSGWCFFTSGEVLYGVLLRAPPAMFSTVYQWKGIFIPVENFTMWNPKSCMSFQIESGYSSEIFIWETGQPTFRHFQSLPVPDVRNIHVFMPPSGLVHILLAAKDITALYSWNSEANWFSLILEAPYVDHITSVIARSLNSSKSLIVLSTESNSQIYEMTTVSNQSDFIPSSGELIFDPGDMEVVIAVNILDDIIPEEEECFRVWLKNPKGGAEIGAHGFVNIIIPSNDNAYGVIAFAQNSLFKQVEEMEQDSLITLNVERLVGTYGRVTVEWIANGSITDVFPVSGMDKTGTVAGYEVPPPHNILKLPVVRQAGRFGSAVLYWEAILLTAGFEDFTPSSGNLTFEDEQATGEIEITIIDDNEVEFLEIFKISLVRVTGGARLGDETVVTVAIPPNDSPVGVFGFEEKNIAVKEPQTPDDPAAIALFTVSRSPGGHGAVKVIWILEEAARHDLTPLNGTLHFNETESQKFIVIRAVEDGILEGNETFTIQLVSAGDAEISPVNGLATITILGDEGASGVVGIAHSFKHVLIGEPSGNYNGTALISLTRGPGIFGEITIYWNITPPHHTEFTEISGTLTMRDRQSAVVVLIQALDDNHPEEKSYYQFQLTGVNITIVRSRGCYGRVRLWFQIINGTAEEGIDFTPTVDQPPIIGNISTVRVTIAKSDNAEGIIEFDPQYILLQVEEDAGVIMIPVVRKRGTYGYVTADFLSRSISALPNGVDYIIHNNSVAFHHGQNQTFIYISIIDDEESEFAEQFEIQLTGATGGAVLGLHLVSQITIAKSDSPQGIVRFINRSQIVLPNPDTPMTVSLVLERTGRLLGDTEINWDILGPNSEEILSPLNSDIGDPVNGSFYFGEGEGGLRAIHLLIYPHEEIEVQEIFVVRLSLVKGETEIDPKANNVTLIIQKFGDPNGIVQFAPESLFVRNYTEPSALEGPQSITLFLRRVQGTLGNITVYWRIYSEFDITGDFLTAEGSVVIADQQSTGEIIIYLLPDDVPELDESYIVQLISVEGGADLDEDRRISKINVFANDDPHGVFALYSDQQSVLMDRDLGRFVQINVTRHAGTFGEVVIEYHFLSHQEEELFAPENERGYLTIKDGASFGVKRVPISSQAFLSLGLNFTLELINVSLVRDSAKDVPKILEKAKSAVVLIPAEAANSQVGFESVILRLTDVVAGTGQAVITRKGVYGSVTVNWISGYPPELITDLIQPGNINPSFGVVLFSSGEQSKVISFRATPDIDKRESFAISLTEVHSNVSGGAQLRSGYTVAEIEPMGIFQFAFNSTFISVEEDVESVTLHVQKLFGFRSNVTKLMYQTTPGSAKPLEDFRPIYNGELIFAHFQTNAMIEITIIDDSVSETEEYFFVNLTSVESLDFQPAKHDWSPRLNPAFSVATINILANDVLHGILSLGPEFIYVEEDANNNIPNTVIINIRRTQGFTGNIEVTIKTFGGISAQSGVDLYPFENVYGKSDFTWAMEGEDFEEQSVSLTLLDGEKESTVSIKIFDDDEPEGQELFYVFLSDPKHGAQIVKGKDEYGFAAFATVFIEGSDLQNGILGFIPEVQSGLVLDEDSENREVLLAVARQPNRAFEDVKIFWRVTFNETSPVLLKDGVNLENELVSVRGATTCIAGQTMCNISIEIKPDNVPEFETYFFVELYAVSTGAALNNSARFAFVTVLESDAPHGLVHFAVGSRFAVAHKKTTLISLQVLRDSSTSVTTMVSYNMKELQKPETIGRTFISPAVAGQDFDRSEGLLTFEPGQRNKFLDVTLTPKTASLNPFPKRFQVVLSNPTGGARLDDLYSVANVTIVSDLDSLPFWMLIDQLHQPLDDTILQRVLQNLNVRVSAETTEEQLTAVVHVIDKVTDVGEKHLLTGKSRSLFYEILCALASPKRKDTRGYSLLAEVTEKFAFSLLTEIMCGSAGERGKNILDSCPYIAIMAHNWYPQQINGHRFDGRDGDSIQVPEHLLKVSVVLSPPQEENCESIQFTEYSSQQWFLTGDKELALKNKVFSMSLKSRSSHPLKDNSEVIYRIYTTGGRIVPQKSLCLLWNQAAESWLSDSGFCRVIDDTSDYVECACSHMSIYAVYAQIDDLSSYNEAFFSSGFICISGFTLAIISHLFCTRCAMFAAKLLTHMMVACLGTQGKSRFPYDQNSEEIAMCIKIAKVYKEYSRMREISDLTSLNPAKSTQR